MNEIIRQLEEERDALENKAIRLNVIIQDLREIDAQLSEKPITSKKKGLMRGADSTRSKDLGSEKSGGSRHESSSPSSRRKGSKYPEEMPEFIIRNMTFNSNIQLCQMIRKEFGIKTNPANLSNYMHMRGIKRAKKEERGPEVKNPVIKEKLRRIISGRPGKRIVFTDEILQLIKDNYSTCKDRELREKIHKKFNVWISVDSIKVKRNSMGLKRRGIEGMSKDEIKKSMKEISGEEDEDDYDPSDMDIDDPNLEDE